MFSLLAVLVCTISLLPNLQGYIIDMFESRYGIADLDSCFQVQPRTWSSKIQIKACKHNIYRSNEEAIISLQGSNMAFHALAFARSRGRCWKPRPKTAVFNTSQGTWRMLLHCKTMFDRRYCIKTENICNISRFFLHYFVSPFHRCLANAISTDYARSRAGQNTSRNGSKSVAPIRSYWKLRSRALTAPELPCLYTAFRRLMHGC